MRDHEAALAKQKAAIDEETEAKLKSGRERIAAEEARKAKLLVGADLEQRSKDLAELQEVLKERDAKLAEAQKAQADLIRKQRELDDAKREMDLTVEKRVQESLVVVRDKAKQEAEDGLKLKVAEKEQQIAGMQRQIEELRRKAEQGSQQLQGEVLELELESLLRGKFPQDLIEPVPKGEFGGDVLHRVRRRRSARPAARSSGNPSARRTGAMAGSPSCAMTSAPRRRRSRLIVIEALPKGIEGFDLVDGVWVAEPRCAIPLAIALRQSLIEVAAGTPGAARASRPRWRWSTST